MNPSVDSPLFDRLHRRIQLNAYGRIMLDHSRRGLAEMRWASERIAALRDPDGGTVRLAFVRTVATGLVPDLLRRFRSKAPRVQFDLLAVKRSVRAAVVKARDACAPLPGAGTRHDAPPWCSCARGTRGSSCGGGCSVETCAS